MKIAHEISSKALLKSRHVTSAAGSKTLVKKFTSAIRTPARQEPKTTQELDVKLNSETALGLGLTSSNSGVKRSLCSPKLVYSFPQNIISFAKRHRHSSPSFGTSLGSSTRSRTLESFPLYLASFFLLTKRDRETFMTLQPIPRILRWSITALQHSKPY